MRRVIVLLSVILVLALAACTPRVVPEMERDGDIVTVTVAAQEALYATTLHIFNAATDDERCGVLNLVDVGCILGDLAKGDVVTVNVTGPIGQVDCIVFGYSDEDLPIASYRPYRCEIGGGT